MASSQNCDEDTLWRAWRQQDEDKSSEDEAEEEEALVENAENPLMMEVIVRNLFNYLSQEELKSCRLVNSFWNKLSIPFIKDVCDIISFNRFSYWTHIKNRSIEDMSQFIECVQASTNFPFCKLDIGASLIKERSHEAILANFFQCIGPWVTEITIRYDNGQDMFSQGIPENIVFKSLRQLKLHALETITKYEDVKSTFEFITSIMANSPSLEKLMLVDHNGLDGKALTFFMNSMEEANCKKISSLDFSAQIDDAHLIQLSNMGLQLKYLYMDFWGSVNQPDSLQILLERQSSTLEEFKIADCAMTSRFMVEFPRMKKLKTLMLEGSFLGRILISFPNISYAKQLPALKRLSFANVWGEWDEFLKYGIQPVNTVEELKLPAAFSDENCLRHAARLFPKIKKLEISAVLHIVNIVYEAMPNLEELILNTKHCDSVDDIITGLTAMECEEIQMFSEIMFKELEEDYMHITTTKPISKLSRLKVLRLKCKRTSDPVEITDVSCRLVLLKMKSLQCLDFWGRYPPSTRISEDVLHKMKEKFLVLC